MKKVSICQNGTLIGELRLQDYIPISGSPVKADNYFVVYELYLRSSVIAGRFLNHFLVAGENLFITQIHLEMDAENCGSLLKTSLMRFDFIQNSYDVFAELVNGYIFPVKVEDTKLIYSKQYPGNSAIMQYERDLYKSMD